MANQPGLLHSRVSLLRGEAPRRTRKARALPGAKKRSISACHQREQASAQFWTVVTPRLREKAQHVIGGEAPVVAGR